ncbi:MAG TPA: hypothetical protein VM577_12620 [Anaerovoracaceae bacterium]|nr:hypothetical protein [Anaerovoracaceae bacterium]
MKKKLIFLLILTLIFSLSGCKDNVNTKRSIDNLQPEDMLPTGTINVDQMTMGLPTAEENNRLAELTQKLQVAISANQDWFSDYIKDYEGQTLPYHPNLGLSEDKYNEYLKLSENIKLYKSADAIISIEKIGDRQYKISQNEGLKLIDNIVIDLSQNTVSTNYGVCKYNGEIAASDDQVATGRWYGYSWMLEEIKDSNNYKSIQFNLGQLEESKKIIIYYQVKLLDDKQKIDDFEVINFSL